METFIPYGRQVVDIDISKWSKSIRFNLRFVSLSIYSRSRVIPHVIDTSFDGL